MNKLKNMNTINFKTILAFKFILFAFGISNALQSQYNNTEVDTVFSKKTNPLKPKIFLIGENHTRMKDAARKAELTSKAKEGEFYLCLEGEYYNATMSKYKNYKDSKSRVFGIEDEYEVAIPLAGKHANVIFRGVHKIADEAPLLQRMKLEFLSSIVFNKYHAEAWSYVNRPFKKMDTENLAKEIDILVKTRERDKSKLQKSDYTGTQLKKMVQESALWSKDTAFVTVSKALAIGFAKMSDKKYSNKLINGTKNFHKFINNPEDTTLDIPFANEYAYTVRNKTMSKRIKTLYKNAKKEGLDLKVIVGAMHLKDLKLLLEESIKGVEVILSGRLDYKYP